MTEFYTYEPDLAIGFADRLAIRLILTVKTERKTNRGTKRYTATWNCYIYNSYGNPNTIVCDDEIPAEVAHEMRRTVNNTLAMIRLDVQHVNISKIRRLDTVNDTYSFRGYISV